MMRGTNHSEMDQHMSNGEHIKLIMESVRERDIDLWIISQFMENPSFVSVFTDRAGIEFAKVLEVFHSLSNDQGESDITVIVSDGEKKTALLIEDKIDAAAMPHQFSRYVKRGDRGVKEGRYADYIVIMTAPQAYLRKNREADKYPVKISYEELRDYADSFGKSLLDEAVREKAAGYVARSDEAVEEFWEHLYAYVEAKYKELLPYKYDAPRGSKAAWPTYRMPVKKTKIQHKSDRGYIDLELRGLAEKRTQFCHANMKLLDEDMAVEVAGKSLAIRVKVGVLDFHKPFDQQIDAVDESLKAAVRLQDLLMVLDLNI